jgi:hypothetical protein
MNKQELNTLWFELIHHKCLYYLYGEYGTVVSDQEYDRLEKLYETGSGQEMYVGFRKDGIIERPLVAGGPKFAKEKTLELYQERLDKELGI